MPTRHARRLRPAATEALAGVGPSPGAPATPILTHRKCPAETRATIQKQEFPGWHMVPYSATLDFSPIPGYVPRSFGDQGSTNVAFFLLPQAPPPIRQGTGSLASPCRRPVWRFRNTGRHR